LLLGSVLKSKLVQRVKSQGIFEHIVDVIGTFLEFEELFFSNVYKLDKGGIASLFLKELIVISVDKAGLESYGIYKEHADHCIVDFLEGVGMHPVELINYFTYLHEPDVESLHFRGSLNRIW
jgi:hypothetical protein